MQLNDTLSTKKGQHLSLNERIEIQSMKQRNKSNRYIARTLGRPHSTINNEVKRGTTTQVKIVNKVKQYTTQYFAQTGQAVYEKNRVNSRKPYKINQVEAFLEFTVNKIKEEKWSPDTVVGRCKLDQKFPINEMVCTKTLYKYIDENLLVIKNIDLHLKTRRNTRKKRSKANKRVLGMSIDQRSKHVDARTEFGHWEIDTVIGTKNKEEPVLLTLVERMTRYEIILKIDGKSESAVNEALQPIKSIPQVNLIFKTITSDNGPEFTCLKECLESISEVYFTHPYSSWERGTNENHNGIIRRFIPKGRRISTVGNPTIRRINEWMNNLPRKIHNYRTPAEIFNEQLMKLA